MMTKIMATVTSDKIRLPAVGFGTRVRHPYFYDRPNKRQTNCRDPATTQ